MKQTATTQNIEVIAEPFYIENESNPEIQQYVFAYRIQIRNQSPETIQLLNRYWSITDGIGEAYEVRGEGVVGEQPIINAGQEYVYVSGCHLKSEVGVMEGSYEMKNSQGVLFSIKIPRFTLSLPNSLN